MSKNLSHILTKFLYFPNLSCNPNAFTWLCNMISSFKFSKSSLFSIEYTNYVNQKCFVSGVHSVYVIFVQLLRVYLPSPISANLSICKYSNSFHQALRQNCFHSCQFISNPAISLNITMISRRVCLSKIKDLVLLRIVFFGK